jgi:hypothetical protein
VDWQDLGMGQPGGDTDLAQKALRLVRLRATASRGQDLDCDLAGMPEVLSQVHRRHPPVTDLFFDTVPVRYGSS